MPKDILMMDIDSIFPNIVLMKLSKFHKNLGDKVTLQRGLTVSTRIDHPDIVYISCLFAHHKDAVERLAKQFPGSEVHIGGTGVNLVTELPYEIEHLMPDYSIYKNCDASYGFTMRGCTRNCGFCVVPVKEKDAHPVADIYEFWDRRHNKIVLYDNNILALPEHFEKISNQLIENNLHVDWNQGLDIRLVNDWNAEILSKLKIFPEPRFAFDNVKSEPMVRRGIEILKSHGIKRGIWDVLMGFDSTFEEDLHRLNVLRELGQRAFMMIYNNNKKSLFEKDERYRHLRVWCNGKMFFAKMSFDEYLKNQKNGTGRMLAKEGKKNKEIEGKLEENVFEFKDVKK